MKDFKPFEDLKIWLLNSAAIATALANVLTPLLEFLGVLGAVTYTFYKLYALWQDEKRKKNEEQETNQEL